MEALMLISRVGSSIGKLKIAVKVELLLVLLAMAEPNVRMDETPKLPRRKTRQNNAKFSIGLLRNKLKAMKFRMVTNKIKMEL